MFLGRVNELSKLKEEFGKKQKSAVLVYGKHGMGKSTLLREASKGYNGTVIYNLFTKTTYEGNLAILYRSVALSLGLPEIRFNTVFAMFDYLGSTKREILIILDEYQYWNGSRKSGEVDSFMQVVIDSLPANMNVVICGSYISSMKGLLREDNPLFGRFSLILHVEEFDYLDASLFSSDLDVREKIRFYSVFGGSPYVLSNLDYSKSLEENIKEKSIGQNSILRNYIENVMLKEIQKSYDVRILECLSNGKKRYSDILSFLNESNSGLLDKQLKNLVSMESVRKLSPINRKDDVRKQFYEINDNLMLFYFSYIFSRDALIMKFGEDSFFSSSILPSLTTFISYRFEDIVLEYFARLANMGRLPGVEDFGSYWYDNRREKKNGQFDVVLKKSDGYGFFECKFYSSPMKEDECKKEEEQVRAVTGLDCVSLGFVSSSGFDFSSSAIFSLMHMISTIYDSL